MNRILDVKMKSKLVNGSNISGFVKNIDLDGTIKKLTTTTTTTTTTTKNPQNKSKAKQKNRIKSRVR